MCPPTSSSQGVSACRSEIRPTTSASSTIQRYVPVTHPVGRGVCGSAKAMVRAQNSANVSGSARVSSVKLAPAYPGSGACTMSK